MILLFFVLFCFCFCFCFYRYGKGMKRKSAVVDHDSFTLISVVHYNCTCVTLLVSSFVLKTNSPVLGRYQSKFQY